MIREKKPMPDAETTFNKWDPKKHLTPTQQVESKPIKERRGPGRKDLASNADEAVILLKQTIKEGTTMHVGHDRNLWIIHLVGLGGRSIMVQGKDLVGAMADVVGKWLRG